MVEKALVRYDLAIGRAIGSVDLNDYTPIDTPAGASGFIWKQLRQLRIVIPAFVCGIYLKEKAMDEYKVYVEGLFRNFGESKDTYLSSDFEELVTNSLAAYSEVARSAMARIVAGYWSRYCLHRLHGLPFSSTPALSLWRWVARFNTGPSLLVNMAFLVSVDLQIQRH